MNSLEIQYFLTIVKYGSFTEAAQTLSVSQPAISKQIRQLEARLHEAVRNEEYEAAARYRDQIRELKEAQAQ